MSTTSSNRTLLAIIAVLLLTNIAVLGYFLWYKKTEKPRTEDRDRNGMSESLQKEVGFTDDQLAQYKIMKEEQREVIRPMFDQMRNAKDSLFRLLSDPNTSDSVLDNVTDGIAQRQKMLDLQAFSYFKRVRTLCTEEQQNKYDSMVLKMFRKMGKPKSETEKTDKQK